MAINLEAILAQLGEESELDALLKAIRERKDAARVARQAVETARTEKSEGARIVLQGLYAKVHERPEAAEAMATLAELGYDVLKSSIPTMGDRKSLLVVPGMNLPPKGPSGGGNGGGRKGTPVTDCPCGVEHTSMKAALEIHGIYDGPCSRENGYKKLQKKFA